MVILSIDLGKVRTGIAVSDKNEILASPVCVIEERDPEKLIKKILELNKNLSVQKIIVGLPVNMDGTNGESAQNAVKFGKRLKELSGLEVVMKDERCTTTIANKYLNISNKHGRKRKLIIDSVAASIILQDYLDLTKNKSE